MLPDLQSSLLCDDVRQERNGKFILIGIFDGLIVPHLPSQFQRVCIVNRWCCGEGTFEQRSRVLYPDGQRVLVEGKPVSIRLAHENHTATSVEFFLNIKFEEAGLYWVEVVLEQQLRLRYPLNLKIATPKPRPPVSSGGEQ